MMTMTKERESVLDPWEETLFEMEAEKRTLAEMREWVAGQGVAISQKGIANFLATRRRRRWQAELLESIASGAEQGREVQAALNANPAPDLETLVRLNRVLILQLATRVTREPELEKFSYEVGKLVLNCVNAQTNAALKARAVSLAEAKTQEARKSDQFKALEGCLESVRHHPDLKKLFSAAFAALKEKIKEAKQI